MKHAGPEALYSLRQLLAVVRARVDLAERRPGIFYRRGRACLHFHEDAAGLFADLRCNGNWERFRVSTVKERAYLLSTLNRRLCRPG